MEQPKITIEIETENAAFLPDWEPEVSRILHDISARLEHYGVGKHPLRDFNGNVSGHLTIT